MKKLNLLGSLLFSAALGMGCSSEKSPPLGSQNIASAQTGIIYLKVGIVPFSLARAKVANPYAIDNITMYVLTQANVKVGQTALSINGTEVTGSIVVQAQENLKVVLVYLDGTQVRYIGEDSDVDVVAGGETSAEIDLHFMGTSISAVEVAQVGDSYTVSWGTRPFATGYLLEESRNSDFSGATVVYEGSALNTDIPAKSAPGEYYYRVRTQTDYGVSAWYSKGWGKVSVAEEEDGTISVKTFLPPDEPAEANEGDEPDGPGILFFEDWEGDWLSKWFASSGSWEVGIAESGPNEARSGENVAATLLKGKYDENRASRLTKIAKFVIPAAAQNPRLRFWHWFSFGAGDSGSVQILKEGSDEWETIGSFNSTGAGIWSYPFIDLTPHAGETVQLGFLLTTKDTCYGSCIDPGDGWYLDDVVVEFDQ